MVTNHWLKKFKVAKRELSFCGVSLFDSSGNEFGPPKQLGIEASWTFEEIEADADTDAGVLDIGSVGIWLKRNRNILWTQDYPDIHLVKGDRFTVYLGNVMIGYDEIIPKWKLELFFNE